MPAIFQVVIDCKDPPEMCKFWAAALGYVVEPPPEGFVTWAAYFEDIGLAPEDLGPTPDSLCDPSGRGPRIWFQVVDEAKPLDTKNRLHFDLKVSGSRSDPMAVRRDRVDAEPARLCAMGATRLEAYSVEGVDHYAVGMLDPEGNEFDIN